ncbi:MAG: hypothetical protein JWQ34_2128 [Mucilaginibacter sp.]|uniref:ATP-binding protein n=1 Tax=Mucilaginibacter sp. TaxID=1882438 RepID=UPI00261CDD38|nr:ATP-binding protein [Mucilaginibacter sp.]MDB5003903.1 hypothetical protein [Mucilaginibacter sp.]
MDKHTSKITAKSIEQSGLPTDYKKALAEYIWNSFDARATIVHLNFESNTLERLESFSISDNGTGIDIETIDDTFGNFLDSNKRDLFNKDNFQKGRKGKGRYAFSTFANSCNWATTVEGPNGKLLSYNIAINKADLQNFTIDDRTITRNTNTGTIVNFYDFFDLSAKSLSSKEFVDYLSCEFGWFLFLNREKGYKIIVNGVELAYDEMIGDSEELIHPIGNDSFKVVFIRWNQKIGDKYYFYFLGQNQKEASKEYTSFNNKAIEFHHSVYIESPFFDSFHETLDNEPVLGFAEKNQSHPTYKTLLTALKALVSKKEKHYVRDIQADKLIKEYQSKGILPESKIKSNDLENVIKEIYCAVPGIFQTSNNQQSKMLVGLVNLLLATGYGQSILEVIESVATLSDEERESLNKVL